MDEGGVVYPARVLLPANDAMTPVICCRGKTRMYVTLHALLICAVARSATQAANFGSRQMSQPACSGPALC